MYRRILCCIVFKFITRAHAHDKHADYPPLWKVVNAHFFSCVVRFVTTVGHALYMASQGDPHPSLRFLLLQVADGVEEMGLAAVEIEKARQVILAIEKTVQFHVTGHTVTRT